MIGVYNEILMTTYTLNDNYKIRNHMQTKTNPEMRWIDGVKESRENCSRQGQ